MTLLYKKIKTKNFKVYFKIKKKLIIFNKNVKMIKKIKNKTN